MFERFHTRAVEAGAEVHRVASRAEAVEVVEQLLRAEDVADEPGCWAVWAPGPFLDGTNPDVLRAVLQTRNPGLFFDVTVARAAGSRVGISEVDRAVADTGSVAHDSTAVAGRLVSTLPRTHVALLPGARVVPDLATYLSVRPPDRSAAVTLITGPSRTTDPERVLTVGVHGPRRLVIVVVDEDWDR